MPHWQELAHYFLPRSGRFNTSRAHGAPNDGGKRHQHILDNTPQRAMNIATAGLMTGASSPARQWFKLRTPYDELNERPAVKTWLALVEKRMRDLFNSSNIYRCLRQNYQELLAFGTAATVVLPDFETVTRGYPLTIGQYALDTDDKGRVNTLYRKEEMRVGQIVQRFGYKNCSVHIRDAYDSKRLAAFFPILHVIEPRRERDPMKVDNRNFRWTSNYYEFGGNDEDVLRESGYNAFPVIAPRWETRGEDTYGSGPGMLALGDTKQLQLQQLRKSQAIDFKSLPPLQVPAGTKVNLTPGSLTYVDVANSPVRNLMNVDISINELREDIMDVRQRIERAFYVDMFLMIAADQRAQPATAREVAERHEEKLLMLGPVLESLHDEMLAPLVELAFAYMLDGGAVPEAPRELQGQPLVVRFVSLLAQAQQLVGLGSIDRLLGLVGNVAGIVPDVLDKVDVDQAVDVYADALGVDPTIIVDDDRVAEIRAARAAVQQQQQAVAAAPPMAAAARDMAEAEAMQPA